MQFCYVSLQHSHWSCTQASNFFEPHIRLVRSRAHDGKTTQTDAPVEESASLPRYANGSNRSYGHDTSVDSADTRDAIMVACVSSFSARGLPCGKCSEFSSSYLADDVHLQRRVQNRRDGV